MKKLLLLTPCENNCLVLAYLENPSNFPLVHSIFSKLVAGTRNYPRTVLKNKTITVFNSLKHF